MPEPVPRCVREERKGTQPFVQGGGGGAGFTKGVHGEVRDAGASEVRVERRETTAEEVTEGRVRGELDGAIALDQEAGGAAEDLGDGGPGTEGRMDGEATGEFADGERADCDDGPGQRAEGEAGEVVVRLGLEAVDGIDVQRPGRGLGVVDGVGVQRLWAYANGDV